MSTMTLFKGLFYIRGRNIFPLKSYFFLPQLLKITRHRKTKNFPLKSKCYWQLNLSFFFLLLFVTKVLSPQIQDKLLNSIWFPILTNHNWRCQINSEQICSRAPAGPGPLIFTYQGCLFAPVGKQCRSGESKVSHWRRKPGQNLSRRQEKAMNPAGREDCQGWGGGLTKQEARLALLDHTASAGRWSLPDLKEFPNYKPQMKACRMMQSVNTK